MPLVIAMVVVVALMVTMWVGVAKERGPGPADVAIAYERGWDELDFGLLYDLSGEELRDGLRRDQFIEVKRHAYARADHHERLASRIDVEDFFEGKETSLVVTRVSAGGGSVRNNVVLERRANGWTVVSYSLRPDTNADASAS